VSKAEKVTANRPFPIFDLPQSATHDRALKPRKTLQDNLSEQLERGRFPNSRTVSRVTTCQHEGWAKRTEHAPKKLGEDHLPMAHTTIARLYGQGLRW